MFCCVLVWQLYEACFFYFFLNADLLNVLQFTLILFLDFSQSDVLVKLVLLLVFKLEPAVSHTLCRLLPFTTSLYSQGINSNLQDVFPSSYYYAIIIRITVKPFFFSMNNFLLILMSSCQLSIINSIH